MHGSTAQKRKGNNALSESMPSATLPKRPWALFPDGARRDAEMQEFLIHKDIETEAQCILLFESLVDAWKVSRDYLAATGKSSNSDRIDVWSLEDRFWVKFYREDGTIIMCPVEEYRKWATLSDGVAP